jgi:hypothetical protein
MKIFSTILCIVAFVAAALIFGASNRPTVKATAAAPSTYKTVAPSVPVADVEIAIFTEHIATKAAVLRRSSFDIKTPFALERPPSEFTNGFAEVGQVLLL